MTLINNGSVKANDYVINSETEIVIDKSAFTDEKFVLLTHPGSDYPISLLHIGEDNYSALLMMCTHQKCKTEWNKDHYVCPCHGARFTETGEVIRGMATESLKSFPVQVTNSEITVQLQ